MSDKQPPDEVEGLRALLDAANDRCDYWTNEAAKAAAAALESETEVRRLEAGAVLMREASRWVLHVLDDVGKAGERPEPGEPEAAFRALAAALAARRPTP